MLLLYGFILVIRGRISKYTSLKFFNGSPHCTARARFIQQHLDLNMNTQNTSSLLQARKALVDRQKDLELKTQQLEIKLSSKVEEDIKKARRKSTQAGEYSFSKPLNRP